MRVGLFVDNFACIGKTPEEEYDEIEAAFQEELPKTKFHFVRNVQPNALSNSSFDVYLFDFGGLCYSDPSGGFRMSLAREITKQVEERPNTLFIPYSKMTRDYQKIAADDAFGDFSPPNLWRADKDNWETRPIQEALRQWEASKREAATCTTFFDPKPEFFPWLKKVAGELPVFDVGCGNGRLIRRLQHYGFKAAGADPLFDPKQHRDLANCVFPKEAERIDWLKRQAMCVLFCRPCHSGFVEDVIQGLHPDSIVLYFSKPENLRTDIPTKWEAEVLDCPGLVVETGYRIHRQPLKQEPKRGKSGQSPSKPGKAARNALGANASARPRRKHAKKRLPSARSCSARRVSQRGRDRRCT